jgi:hypothetical protein
LSATALSVVIIPVPAHALLYARFDKRLGAAVQRINRIIDVGIGDRHVASEITDSHYY